MLNRSLEKANPYPESYFTSATMNQHIKSIDFSTL